MLILRVIATLRKLNKQKKYRMILLNVRSRGYRAIKILLHNFSLLILTEMQNSLFGNLCNHLGFNEFNLKTLQDLGGNRESIRFSSKVKLYLLVCAQRYICKLYGNRCHLAVICSADLNLISMHSENFIVKRF